MRWRKLGLVVDPAAARAPWMRTHAALPLAVPLEGDTLRVYCAGRDAEGRAQIGWVDVRVGERPAVVASGGNPLVSFGALGAFDDRGVLPSSLVRLPDRWLLYFTGVMLGKTVPFYYAVGLAASVDEGSSWQKLSAAPILDRSDVDPYLTASPCVLHENGVFRMWYTSGVRWALENGEPKHYYHLKYAESEDGIAWRRTGRVAIDFKTGEYAISRPCVVRDADGYRMWYAYRGSSYRIGYAESADGLVWKRMDDKAGVDVSPEGWDAKMQCYPHVFDHGGRRYMFYNGNGFGKSGVGLAVLEE